MLINKKMCQSLLNYSLLGDSDLDFNKTQSLIPKYQIIYMQNPSSPNSVFQPILAQPTHQLSTANSVFQKYRNISNLPPSAFKVYNTDASIQVESEETPNQGGKLRGSYRKYTMEEKQTAVLKILNGHDVKEVSKQFGIPRRNLLRWRKNGCKRKEGGGRPTDHQMQCILYDKIKKRQIKSQKQIRTAAIQVSRSESFKASKGWFSKFSRRYKLQTGQDLLKA